MEKKLFFLATFLISIAYIFLRYHDLSQKLVFRPDQGLHLLETYQMVKAHKIRLLGPIVSSKNFANRNFFIGPFYYYSLSVLGITTGWNPLLMTLLYGFIEFGFIIYFIYWLKNKFNVPIALLIFIFLTFNPYLISHSRFYWNPHFLIPLGIIELVFLDSFFYKPRPITLFFSSIIWGFAFSFHYAAILWIIFYIFIIFRKKLLSYFSIYLIIISGFFLGDFPFFLSELRHNFYNFRTIIFVYTHSSHSSQLYNHYFIFPLLIFFLFLISWILDRYHSKNSIVFLIVFCFISLTYLIKPVDELSSIPNWLYPDQLKAINLILKTGCPPNYNLAETISGDTRSYDLRSLLTVAGCPPLSVESYPNASIIFLLAPPNRPTQTETVWEISSFKPFTVKSMVKLNDQVILYQLEKVNVQTTKNI
jgi:hypothetical protein